jgi:hypothetical protein
MAFAKASAAVEDGPSDYQTLDGMEFVRRVDHREYAELDAELDQANVEIDALHFVNQALRVALEHMTQVVSNSRLPRRFHPRAGRETLIPDLAAWEEHPKFVLLRDIVSSRLPSEAGYIVFGRQPCVTPRLT